MKYIFNFGTLIIVLFLIFVFGGSLLIRYWAAKSKPKKKKNADPYRKNEYVRAHKSMLDKERWYESNLADCEEDEIEAYKAKKPVFSRNVNERYNS